MLFVVEGLIFVILYENLKFIFETSTLSNNGVEAVFRQKRLKMIIHSNIITLLAYTKRRLSSTFLTFYIFCLFFTIPRLIIYSNIFLIEAKQISLAVTIKVRRLWFKQQETKSFLWRLEKDYITMTCNKLKI